VIADTGPDLWKIDGFRILPGTQQRTNVLYAEGYKIAGDDKHGAELWHEDHKPTRLEHWAPPRAWMDRRLPPYSPVLGRGVRLGSAGVRRDGAGGPSLLYTISSEHRHELRQRHANADSSGPAG